MAGLVSRKLLRAQMPASLALQWEGPAERLYHHVFNGRKSIFDM